jgi:lysozyme
MRAFRASLAIIPLTAAALVIVGLLCWLGLWIPNYPSEVTYPVRGIDVSHRQGDVDWGAVVASKIRFAYIKATKGADFKDGNFVQNWEGSRDAGISRGAYHFFALGTSGKLQAANFLAAVPVDPRALPPAIDLEISGYNRGRTQSPNDFAKELSVFFDIVSAHYGKSPVIYTTYDFQKRYLKKMSVDRLWIREIIATPRQNWMFWQFSDRGKVQGIKGFVDLDVFHGSVPEFEALLETNRQ